MSRAIFYPILKKKKDLLQQVRYDFNYFLMALAVHFMHLRVLLLIFKDHNELDSFFLELLREF